MATILVIEDTEAIRFTMAASLRYQGHTVIEAGNGREGMERHAQGLGAFDLVVCDLLMPEVSGAEAIKRIHSRAADLPILAVSGAMDALEEVRLRSGCDSIGALAKPFTRTEFIGAVDRLLSLRAVPALDRFWG